MSFLSLAFLTALPLIAAPILLHLFDRRRNVVIEWGAMEFLLEAAAQKTSARKLKQWLLILLRVLTVLFLILALSRPTLPGNWFGTSERTETIVVLDNSLSMNRQAGEETRFDAALAKVTEITEQLSDGDSIRILLASPYPIWATAGSLRVDAENRDQITERLHELKTSGSSSDLLAALFTAVQAERQPTLSNRRIVLVTDGQSSDWTLDDRTSWERFRETLKSSSIPTELEIVELSDQSVAQSNLAVQDVRSNRMFVGIDQPLMLTAQIVNHGNSTSSPRSVTWTIGNKTFLESDVPTLEGESTREVYWQHSFSQPGSYAIHCRVDTDDVLQADNEATTIIEVVESIPVLLVESHPGLAEMQRDAFFVQAALGWVDGQPLEERSVHTPRMISPEELSHIDLSGQHAVVIPNFQSLSQDSVERLAQFVYEGGGLWIGLGPRTDAEIFNQFLFAEGNGLAPLELDRIREQSNDQDGSAGTKINPFQKEHPATAQLTDSQKLDTGDVSVTHRWRFQRAPEGQETSVLLSLTDGEPLAVEKYHGRGRVIVQAIPLRMQWSDLARSQAFVVMTQEWMSYLTQPKAVEHNLSPGDPIVLERPDQGLRNAILNTPQGDEIELTADVRSDRVVFQSGRTALPGDYTLEIGTSGDKTLFHVRRDVAESNLAPLDSQDRQRLASVTNLRQEVTKTGGQETIHSEPLWPLLLMLLIGLIAGELILSGIIARERFGSEPISESSEKTGSSMSSTPMEPIASRQRPKTPQQVAEELGIKS